MMTPLLRTCLATICFILAAVGLVGMVTNEADAASTSYMRIIHVAEDRFANYDFGSKQAAEHADASKVDWAVSMIFWNAANKREIKEWYFAHGAGTEGSAQWGGMDDKFGWETQPDNGVKTSCPVKGKSYHMRLYANGSTPSMFNRSWGYYVIGTTHRDVNECQPFKKWRWFGESEESEHWFAEKARVKYGSSSVHEDDLRMYNRQGWPTPRRVGDHEWHNDGRATTVYVSRALAHSTSVPGLPPLPEEPGGEGEGEGGGGEEPSPPPPGPPVAQTLAVSEVTPTKATLNGTVNPEGSATKYYFEYGTTTAYGSVIPIPSADAGAGTAALSFSALVTGLKGATTYHYQIVASNAGGTAYGADRSFKTKLRPESDVNGDGRSDLVTLNANGYVYTYIGLANGGLNYAYSSLNGELHPGQENGVGAFPIDVADVNGDGYDDLVTMNSSGAVSTALGQADGHFGARVASGFSATPAIIGPGAGDFEPAGVADANGDGRGDLVLLSTSGALYTYLGAANGSFGSSPVVSSAINSATFDGEGEYMIDVADLDNDGLADLVTQKSNGSIAAYRGAGGGAFQGTPITSLAGALHPSMEDGAGYEPVAVADVSGDGNEDLVVHSSGGTLSTYLGTGTGSFTTRVDTAGTFDSNLFDGSGSELGTVIDVNGDGSADLVRANRSDGNVYVHLGQASGSFGAATTNLEGAYVSTRANRHIGAQMAMEKPIRRRDGCRPTGCGIDPKSDVNGDHRSELVTLDGEGTLYSYLAKWGKTPGKVTSYKGGLDPAQYDESGYYPLAVEDVNGDGYDDLVTMQSNGTVGTYLGQANGGFGANVSSLTNTLVPSVLHPSLGEIEPIGVGDTNGDHRGDLVVYSSVERTIYTYYGQATGGFSTTKAMSLYHSADSAYFDSVGDYFIDVADVTGDGAADLVALNSNGNAETYKSNGSGGFESTPVTSFGGTMNTSLATGTGYEPIAVADVNGDGRADFVAHGSGGTVSTYLGNPSGSFSTRADTSGSFDSNLFDGTGGELGTVIDVNGDGFGDLIWVQENGVVSIQLGQRNGAFAGSATTYTEGYVSSRRNRSGQQMVNEQPLRRRSACARTGCGIDPKSDVNGDHRSDLVALSSTGTVNAYLGQSSGSLGTGVASRTGELDPAQYDGVGYYPVAVEDVNGDGYDDLVTMHSSGTVRTFPGQANGTLGAPVASLTNALAPAVLAPAAGEYEPIGVGDTNGDHFGDLVVFDNYDRTVYTYRGQASGGFGSAPVASVTLISGAGNGDSAVFDGVGDYFVDVADVTGDGLADLVAQNTNGNGETYKATGTGGFESSPVTSFAGGMSPAMATGAGTEPIAVADVNGDGRADFVGSTGSTLSTYLGQANGTFTTRADTSGSLDSNLFDGTGSELGTVIDVNGDGYGDLVWAKDSDGNVYVQPGRRDGTFGAATSSLGGSYVSSRRNRSGQQMVNEQPLRRRSACRTTGCGIDPKSDVNGDHRADLVTLHTSGSVYTYPGKAGGEFSSAKVSSMTLASESNGVMDPAQYDGVGYYPLAVEDVNGDGYDDLVALDSAGTVGTYTGAVTAGFSGSVVKSLENTLVPAILAPTPGKYEPIGVGDATGDGRGDLVAFNSVDKTVYTFPGQADGSFSGAKVASLTTASGTGLADSALFDSAGDYFVDVADVTGDGLADLVAQSTNGNGETYVATGGGGFAATPVNSFGGAMNTSLATGTGYEPIAVADVNGDGRADFVAHHAIGAVYTYLGQSNGSFTYRITTSTPADSNLYDGEGSELATVIDVNGDGFGDLVSANRGDGKVYVQLGRREGNFGNASAQLTGYVSTRHSQASGQQIVTERPLRRRSACAANGCH